VDLRLCVSQFDRDTQSPSSAREDISEADANRIIDSIEGARDKRAERIQQEAQKRISALKQQAQKQAAETRKRSRRCRLFSTALTSSLPRRSQA